MLQSFENAVNLDVGSRQCNQLFLRWTPLGLGQSLGLIREFLHRQRQRQRKRHFKNELALISVFSDFVVLIPIR